MKDLLETLRRDGIVRLPELAPAAAITDFLRARPVANAHVPFQGKETRANLAGALGAGWPMCCNSMADVINAPCMLEYATRYLDLAGEYLRGADPVGEAQVYSFNAFWTQPSAARYEQTHKWHRDGDYSRFVVLYIYGTDVLKPEDGAHVFVKTSHRVRDDDLPKDRAPLLETVLGPAGTMFLSDSRGLHYGTRPQVALRSLLWIRWYMPELPRSYVWDKMRPAVALGPAARYLGGLTAEERRALRLVVA